MSEVDNRYEHWCALVERRDQGQALSADEQSFCRRYESDHPECARELQLYAALSDVDATPDTASRALVDATLARMEAEEAARELDEATTFRRGGRALAGLVFSGVAIAASVLVYLWTGTGPARDTAAAARAPQALPAARAELVYASGEVRVSGADAAVGRTLIHEGSVIETGAGSACVLLDPEINVCLSQRSRLQLSAITSAARELRLLQGEVATRLAPQPEGMSLSIRAADVLSTAVGTAFSVRLQPGGAVVTTVLSGKVRVGRKGAGQVVGAHERIKVAAHAEHTPVTRSEEAPSWALLGPTTLWHDPIAATLELRGEPAGAEAWLDEQQIGKAPLSSLVPVGSHRLVVRSDGVVLADQTLHMSAGETQRVVYAPRPSATPPQVTVAPGARRLGPAARKGPETEPQATIAPEAPAAPPAQDSASELLRKAREQVREADFTAAATSYREVIDRFAGTAEAHTVLVSLAQLQLTKLANPAAALASLERYLAIGGPLAEEARVAKVRALRALGRDADEASAIDELLAQHPASLDASTLRQRLSTLRPPQ